MQYRKVTVRVELECEPIEVEAAKFSGAIEVTRGISNDTIGHASVYKFIEAAEKYCFLIGGRKLKHDATIMLAPALVVP